MTNFFETREVPQVWEIAALLRLNRLDRAIIAIEENTLTIWLFGEGQTGPVSIQAHVSLDELMFAQVFESRQPGQFTFTQAHVARPPATGGATLAFVENWHRKRQCYFVAWITDKTQV